MQKQKNHKYLYKSYIPIEVHHLNPYNRMFILACYIGFFVYTHFLQNIHHHPPLLHSYYKEANNPHLPQTKQTRIFYSCHKVEFTPQNYQVIQVIQGPCSWRKTNFLISILSACIYLQCVCSEELQHAAPQQWKEVDELVFTTIYFEEIYPVQR